MPTGGLVHVDANNNNAAILGPSSIVIASDVTPMPTDDTVDGAPVAPTANDSDKVNQSQDAANDDDGEHEEKECGVVSPMPPKKLNTLMKEVTTTTITSVASTKKTTFDDKAKKSSPTSKPAAANNKSKRKKRDNATVVTPRSSKKSSKKGSASTTMSGAPSDTNYAASTPKNKAKVPLATPGEESAKKNKKDQAKKNPGLTLDSFFGAKKKNTSVGSGATITLGGGANSVSKVKVVEKSMEKHSGKEDTSGDVATRIAGDSKVSTATTAAESEESAKDVIEIEDKDVTGDAPAKKAKAATKKSVTPKAASAKKMEKSSKAATKAGTKSTKKSTESTKKVSSKPKSTPAIEIDSDEDDSSPSHALAVALSHTLQGSRRRGHKSRKIALEEVSASTESIKVPFEKMESVENVAQEASVGEVVAPSKSEVQVEGVQEEDATATVEKDAPVSIVQVESGGGTSCNKDTQLEKDAEMADAQRNLDEDVEMADVAEDEREVPEGGYDSDATEEIAPELKAALKEVSDDGPATTEQRKSTQSTNDEVMIVDSPPQAKATATKTEPTKMSIADAAKSTAEKSTPKTAVPDKGMSIDNSLMLAACSPKKANVAEFHKEQVESTASTEIKRNFASIPSEAAVANSKSPSAKKQSKKSAVSKEEPKKAPLSEENVSRMQHYSTLRERYVTRAVELASRPASDDFEEERWSLKDADLPAMEKESVEIGENGEFPDALLPRLLVVVQGSSLPLSTLSKNALDELNEFATSTRSLTVESISSKIKLLAQRKSFLGGNPPAQYAKPTPISKLDCFENVEECYFWRWELETIDLLPPKDASKVKRGRAVRRKLQNHHKAVFRLLSSIDDATKWLENNGASAVPSASVPVLAKVSDMEEKVLKFEREFEKARLLKEAKSKKQQGKSSELAEKQKEKERLAEEKANEKKRKDEEKALAKAEAAKEREDAKRNKALAKAEAARKEQQELEEKETKRKARMMSFFSSGNAMKKQKSENSPAKASAIATHSAASFDSDAFRLMIGSQEQHASKPFAKLSQKSRASRQRKTKNVNVSVFVTVLSDNPFAPQPYDEERIISVPNKYKFLGFHEDVRPPYHGTWSKPRSTLVTGRNPLGQDTQFLDYEVDSEAEWEEADDEPGEDCDEDAGDEEDETPNEEDNDGWLAEDDDLGIEDEDQETREMRKKKLLSEAMLSSAKACVIAPLFGGLPVDTSKNDIDSAIEGFNPQDATNILASHVGCVFTPNVTLCLDAFPPTATVDTQAKKDATQGEKGSSQKMTMEASKTMAQFVHNCTTKSKETLVTELLIAHPSITNSRAQTMRELSVIAEKRRVPNGGGVVWEVKKTHLDTLGLKESDLKHPPKVPEPKTSSTTAKASSTTPPKPKKVKVTKAIKPKSASPKKATANVPAPDPPAASSTPVAPAPPSQTKPTKKRKSDVSAASANLFAAFLSKKSAKKQKTE
ncbi:predicted protein [Thalassiosira pseudonana CCMP1335]|uniref:Chromatin assembly factor 1 subunit A dimerization domain-containing protein n=1 Tax=Thalassiosira pseudonana TaxID=35128 RepID=B8BRD7_THAPS|nr:predicted protein [Thalassiosira pseudonana CCMP1335]EED96522.1 predicted protein [Thalassiosira pseudonana CCMP1335]